MKKAFVARNHNTRLIAWNEDVGNLMEALMFYEEQTGNRCSVSIEEFEDQPEDHRY
jgi:hypothetical protein